jgi:hypothetical protein
MEDWRLSADPLWNVEVPSFARDEVTEPNISLQLPMTRRGASETLKINMTSGVFEGLLEALEAAEELINQA